MGSVTIIILALLGFIMVGLAYGYIISPVGYKLINNEALWNSSTIQSLPETQRDQLESFQNSLDDIIVFSVIGLIAIPVFYVITKSQKRSSYDE